MITTLRRKLGQIMQTCLKVQNLNFHRLSLKMMKGTIYLSRTMKIFFLECPVSAKVVGSLRFH